MEKILIIVAISLITASYWMTTSNPQLDQTNYTQWKQSYNKKFDFYDDLYRLQVYNQNLELIEAHNQGIHSYLLKENQFMGLTNEEFQVMFLGEMMIGVTQDDTTTLDPPIAGIDWTGTSEVRDQGKCGASWAFAAIGNVESGYKIKSGTIVELSVQQLVDCETYSQGCTWGFANTALKYIAAYGIRSESQYPYKASQGTCRNRGGSYKTNGVKQVQFDDIKYALQAMPISVGLDATNWQFYGGGVFDNCGNNNNHFALLMGFDGNGDWIVKNSWGLYWGDKGYIRIKSGNTCGIGSNAFQPI